MWGSAVQVCSGLQVLKFFGGIAQLARASALQAEGRRFDSVYLHNEKDFGFPEVFFWFYLQSTDIVTAQRKIPVDLHFIVSLSHKASGAALGLSCAVCFEQPAGVFAGCGAVCFIGR